MNRAVFLDRDGVINRKAPEGAYVTCWKEMHFLPGVAKAISLLREVGFCIIVVSNQRCVAKGLITADGLDALHRRMCNELAAAGAIIDAVYYCPHEKQPPCSCRKPAPGMLLSAAYEHQVDLAASWMIGDSEDDVQAGKNAGCKTARLVSGDDITSSTADVAAQSLVDVVHKILPSVDHQRAMEKKTTQ
jgi:D-glycero-D-manno-heptose 1,7-bisphosphate phosphatase